MGTRKRLGKCELHLADNIGEEKGGDYSLVPELGLAVWDLSKPTPPS